MPLKDDVTFLNDDGLFITSSTCGFHLAHAVLTGHPMPELPQEQIDLAIAIAGSTHAARSLYPASNPSAKFELPSRFPVVVQIGYQDLLGNHPVRTWSMREWQGYMSELRIRTATARHDSAISIAGVVHPMTNGAPPINDIPPEAQQEWSKSEYHGYREQH